MMGSDMLYRNVGSQLGASARNIPDERLYRLNRCGSLEFRNGKFNKTLFTGTDRSVVQRSLTVCVCVCVCVCQ